MKRYKCLVDDYLGFEKNMAYDEDYKAMYASPVLRFVILHPMNWERVI